MSKIEITETEIQTMIALKCDQIKTLLLKKNKEYGMSAFVPKRIFSSADTVEQLKVRIDDKLSRISNDSSKSIKEDTVSDLIGYLILLQVSTELLGSVLQTPAPAVPVASSPDASVAYALNDNPISRKNETMTHVATDPALNITKTFPPWPPRPVVQSESPPKKEYPKVFQTDEVFETIKSK